MKRLHSRHLRLVTLVLALSAMCAATIPTVASAWVPLPEGFSGYVTDAETGQPLSGAYIEVLTWPGGTGAGNDSTDASGHYSLFGNFTDGQYRVHFSGMERISRIEGIFDHAGSDYHRVDHELWSIVHRVSGQTRYSTAVATARLNDDRNPWVQPWGLTDDVVIASGEDRAAADPLAASGLCWYYSAPLFLTKSTSVPPEVLSAIDEIAANNGDIDLHIVGGPVSVPDARVSEIVAYVASHSGHTVTPHRVLATGSRYDLSAAIARLVASHGAWPKQFLVANGADPTKFFDALALSPLARQGGRAILLVSRDTVPTATRHVLSDFDVDFIAVAGGTNTISDGVFQTVKGYADVGAERWWGQNRYATAVSIATHGLSKGWFNDEYWGVAAKLPDALSGGAALGYMGAPLLLVKSDGIPAETGQFIDGLSGTPPCFVFGGPNSVPESVRLALLARLKAAD